MSAECSIDQRTQILVKILDEEPDFPFFPDRRIVLSVGVRYPEEFDQNASEALIRDLCIADARSFLTEYSGKAEFFSVRRESSGAVVDKAEGVASSVEIDFSNKSELAIILFFIFFSFIFFFMKRLILFLIFILNFFLYLFNIYL